MAGVLVDSNVLLDVITEDPQWNSWSSAILERTANRFPLIINPVVYGEVSVHFLRIEELDDALPRSMFTRAAIPFDAAFLAGKALLVYRRRGGSRRSPVPDFFISAHAAIAGYQLLTRDVARYRTYFPELALIAPE